jgi:hypothetical protein
MPYGISVLAQTGYVIVLPIHNDLVNAGLLLISVVALDFELDVLNQSVTCRLVTREELLTNPGLNCEVSQKGVSGINAGNPNIPWRVLVMYCEKLDYTKLCWPNSGSELNPNLTVVPGKCPALPRLVVTRQD